MQLYAAPGLRPLLLVLTGLAVACSDAGEDPITGLSYAGPIAATVGVPLAPVTPQVTGGTPTQFSVSPALPAGLSLDASTGVLSGTPTAVSARRTYEVTAANAGSSARAPVELAVDSEALEPVGTLEVRELGAGVSATTDGFADVVLGPLAVGGVSYTLRIPAIAVPEGVEVTMTPVTFESAPFTHFGGVRFGPSGTVFRVPAELEIDGVPEDAPLASVALRDDGTDAALTFATNRSGTARVLLEHFSVYSIVDAGTTRAAVGAAGLAHVPRDTIAAAPLLTGALEELVRPAIAEADRGLDRFAYAVRMYSEWDAAVQARRLSRSSYEGLGGRTFGAVSAEASDALIAAGQRLLADLSRPTCQDGTGLLHHPHDWFTALGHMAWSLKLLGGDAATPRSISPCLTLSFSAAVAGQGRTLARSERFVQVFLGLEATTPSGFTAPVTGTYRMELDGATVIGTEVLVVDAPSPGLMPIDLDRGETCDERAEFISALLTGVLRDTYGLWGLDLDPAEVTLEFREPATADDPGTCEEPAPTTVTISPAQGLLHPGGTHTFTAVTNPPGLPVTWSVIGAGGTVDADGVFSAGETAGFATLRASTTGGAFASAPVAVVPNEVVLATTSRAIVPDVGSFTQFAIWSWSLDLTRAVSAGEMTLRRAERTTPPVAPAYELTVTVGAPFGSSQTAGIGGGDETAAFFHATFFDTGPVRIDLSGVGLPPALCDACQPPSLLETTSWIIERFP